ncbi:MAG: hypothetical protein QOK39_618 [Acidimicrobiaceae bacterium]|jgi:hypothetical protein|nr:hypothetical protein [Acidimicrobiaceae bacterium]
MLAFGRFDAHNRADSLQVWTIEPSSVTGPYLISAPDSGCSLALPRFAGNGLFAVERCPSTPAQISAPVTLRLELLDPTTGTKQRSWALASAPSAMLADLAVDPTGGWGLYSLGTNTVNGQVSLLNLGPATANSRVLLNDTLRGRLAPHDRGSIGVTTMSAIQSDRHRNLAHNVRRRSSRIGMTRISHPDRGFDEGIQVGAWAVDRLDDWGMWRAA